MKNSRNNLSIVTLLLAALFAGCVKDEGVDNASPMPQQGIPVTLSIGEAEQVQVRSVASENERKIVDAFVLIFDKTDKYKDGERIDIGNIEGNGQQKPKFTLSKKVAAGDKIVVLLNTGYTGATIPLTVGDALAKINEEFQLEVKKNRDDKVGFSQRSEGLNLPMSGWKSVEDEQSILVPIYRSVAKFNVLMEETAEFSDRTELFTHGKVDFIVLNNPRYGAIYSANHGTIQRPLGPSISFLKKDYYENEEEKLRVDCWVPVIQKQKKAQDSDPDPIYKPSFYSFEWNSAGNASGAEVSNELFSKDRMCVLLRVKEEASDKVACYYRLDIASDSDKPTRKFLDVHRNKHYLFTVSSVKSNGYATIDEALANPGSNLEYTVTVGDSDDSMWASTTGNGQYAVSTSRDTVYVYNGDPKGELLTIAVQNHTANAKVTTRRISLVDADGKEITSGGPLQLLDAANATIENNKIEGEKLVLSTSTEYVLNYQVNYTDYDSYIKQAKPVYVKIDFGNITHLVPVSACLLKAKVDPAEYDYSGKGTSTSATTGTESVWSYRVDFKAKGAVDAVYKTEYLADSLSTWEKTVPLWTTNWTAGSKNTSTSAIDRKFNVLKQRRQQVTNAVSDSDNILRKTPPVDSSPDKPYDLSTEGGKEAQETANCYVVNAPGTYSLPLVYGNGIKKGAYNPQARKTGRDFASHRRRYNYTDGDGTLGMPETMTGYEKAFLIHTRPFFNSTTAYAHAIVNPNDMIEMDEDNRGLDGVQQNIVFTISPGKIKQGNAVIAIREKRDGDIIWSWHIWVTPYKLKEGLVPIKNSDGTTIYEFMPRNLGWCDSVGVRYSKLSYPGRGVKIRYTQTHTGKSVDVDLVQKEKVIFDFAKGKNPVYQFGRKDPLEMDAPICNPSSSHSTGTP